MEICKNTKTGKTFVYLDDEYNGQMLMVTPDGAVKALEADLFTEPVEIDDDEEETVVGQGLVNDTQYAVYHRYHQN